MSYRINNESITYKVFDGEVVIINLQKGLYYSLSETAALLWQWIQENQTLDGMVQKMLCLYEGGAEEMKKSVLGFLLELEREGIILPVPSDASKQPFPQPVLHKYNDLQDLLLLDPIHEVNAAGWPFYEPSKN